VAAVSECWTAYRVGSVEGCYFETENASSCKAAYFQACEFQDLWEHEIFKEQCRSAKQAIGESQLVLVGSGVARFSQSSQQSSIALSRGWDPRCR
jgi:hypothetical protein